MNKFFRWLRREHPVKTFGFLPVALLGAGTGALAVATGGAAGPLLILPFAGGWVAITADRSSIRDNSHEINGFKLFGERKDLHRIERVQTLIDRWTRDMRHLSEIPASLQDKIRLHIEDVADSLSRVRVMSGNAPSREFSFYRRYYDATGADKAQPLAVIDLVPREFIEAPMPIQLSVAPLKALTADFKSLPPPQAQAEKTVRERVDGLEDRLDALENPRAVELDKSGKPGLRQAGVRRFS